MSTTPGGKHDPRPLALVTGASAGIGRAYAERLAADGWDLVITGRRVDRLDDLAGAVSTEHGAAVEVVPADLGTESGLAAIDDLCRNRPLEMLVNNAGAGFYKPFVGLPEKELREIIAVEVLAPTLHSRTAAVGMVARGSGAIITVSSLLAFSDATSLSQFPPRVVYASAKAYVVMFSRLLAAELDGTGVRVQVVCPGIVRTEFHSRQDIDLSQVPRLEPPAVVHASLAALAHDEVVCIPTLHDPTLVAARDDAQGEMLRAALPPLLADRYGRKAI